MTKPPISIASAVTVDDVYAALRDGAIAADLDDAGALVVEPVAGGIRAVALRTPTLPPATHTSSYWLGPEQGQGAFLVVDPATPYPGEQAKLFALIEREATAGRALAGVVLTHHHGDHVGAADALRQRFGITIAAHHETARLLAGVLQIDELLDEGQVLQAGTSTWIAHVTPGHAPGHICLRRPSDDTLIAGDMVAGIGTILIDPSDGDMIAYLASLGRLAALGAQRLLPAHGPIIEHGQALLRGYVTHRLAREAKVVAALRQLGLASAARLTPLAYADTPPALWPLAQRSLTSHLGKLIAEGTAVMSGTDPVDGEPATTLL